MPTDPHQLAAEIKSFARRLGFELVGITAAEPSKYRDYFRAWLDDGRAGTMDYLGRRFEERVDPRTYLPSAVSVICVAQNYFTPLEPVPAGEEEHHARIARYCLGDDYHDVLKKRLWKLADWLRETVPDAQTRTCVDTAPVMERETAARAGVGWVGKNCCVINPTIGSWLLLGEIITTIELPTDEPQVDRCGTCRRCIDACPTDAIVEPYKLDASKCISYLTIEHDGPIPEKFQAQLGPWLYGCDVCQDVCPWNSKSIPTAERIFQPRFKTGTIDLREMMNWSPAEYSKHLSRSAMKRVKLPVLQQNGATVQKNLKNKSPAGPAGGPAGLLNG